MNGKLKDSIVVILSLILSIEAIFLVFGETISNMFVSAETDVYAVFMLFTAS